MSGHGGGRRKRRGGHGGGGGHGDARFLVTYADLLTVLMALFLVLWVLATIDLNKFKKFTQGLGDFGNPAAEVVENIEDASPGQTMPEVVADDATKGETVETIEPATGNGDGEGAGDGELTSEQLNAVAQDLTASLAAANVPTTATTIRVEARGLIVTVQTDGVLFESGGAAMTTGGRDILAVLAPDLAAIANRIIIEGHTDKRPLARNGYDNWNLSADRAISVLRTLMYDLGVPADRLAATGYAEFHPLDTGDTAEALAKNRRVEIVVVAKSATAPATPAPKAATEPAATESDESSGSTTTQTTTNTAADH